MARLMLFLIFSSFLRFNFFNDHRLVVTSANPTPGLVETLVAEGIDLSGSYLSASQCTLTPQDELTFTLRLYNRGDQAASAAVTNRLPSGLELIQGTQTAGGSYDEAARLLWWEGVIIPPGSSVSLDYKVRAAFLVGQLTVITNQATVQVNGLSFERKVSIALVPEIAPRLVGSFQTASQTSLAPGEELVYTIHLHNSGVATATLDVADPVPPELSYIPGSASPGNEYDHNLNRLSWKGLSVAPGEERDLVFRVVAAQPVGQEQAVINTAYIRSGEVTLFRKAAVTLLPGPPGEEVDVQPPVVDKVTIGEADVLSDRQTTLYIRAADDRSVESMFIREWVLNSRGLPFWEVVQSSGWVDYQERFAWTLSPAAGAHFIGVWAGDRAGNQSGLGRAGIDSASLLLPETEVTEKGNIVYLVYYPEGVNVTATLDPLRGDPDLYAWAPGDPLSPYGKSTHQEGSETLNFTTNRAGTYLFLVHGYTSATFLLNLSPDGGPDGRSWKGEAAILNASEAPPLKPGELTTEPILSQSGLDPLGSETIQPPEGLRLRLFLPLLIHR